jgi:hypothetical protein
MHQAVSAKVHVAVLAWIGLRCQAQSHIYFGVTEQDQSSGDIDVLRRRAI